jgi:uncharacterized membrane protein
MLSTTQKVFLVIAALFYITAGILHFRIPEFYMRIMPPYIPWHLAMVQISGVAEIAGGVGLLIPQLRRAAAWGLVALLIAVFPANLYAATSAVKFSWILWLRLPLQAVLIWWVLACTKPAKRKVPLYRETALTAD